MDTRLQKNIPLWGENIPFRMEGASADTEFYKPDVGDGKVRISGVTIGSLTFFPVCGKEPRPCVIVCPGGGYKHLSFGHEGADICSWLNSLGFSAFLLKYRCPDQKEGAHADMVRAIRLVRSQAEAFHINPEKVGVMGFSAGGHLCATVSTPGNAKPYEEMDEIDQYSFRPDFAALIYPAYLQEGLENGSLQVDEKTPPTLMVQAQDDFVPVEGTLAYYLALKKGNVPCEMHLYPDGLHGYGIIRTGAGTDSWSDAVVPWLKKQGALL